MNVDTNQKALFLMDMDNELESILQKVTSIRPENMLTIQCYGPVISHPYGDIMRAIIIAIYQENVEEIFVVGTENKGAASVNLFNQLDSMKEKIQTLDYLFQNNRPEFSNDTVIEWLNGKENDPIEKCVHTIHHHPLVPSNVNVRGLIVNKKDGSPSIIEVPAIKTASNLS
ncbi:carbonic anhydrase [Cytobacillus sp.]|uniref:carbonic anhydrase n=1 Tax=Cytobacillus sp. TaxID=2675269 RepID=UPI0028BF45B2|nr:carbonic anhydrase [Cytobacillus sp.]